MFAAPADPVSLLHGNKKHNKNEAESSSVDVSTAVYNQISELQLSQPQLLSLLQGSQKQLQTLSQASLQSLEFLSKMGQNGMVAEQQYAYIYADSHLHEFYISFVQAVT